MREWFFIRQRESIQYQNPYIKGTSEKAMQDFRLTEIAWSLVSVARPFRDANTRGCSLLLRIIVPDPLLRRFFDSLIKGCVSLPVVWGCPPTRNVSRYISHWMIIFLMLLFKKSERKQLDCFMGSNRIPQEWAIKRID